MPRSKGGRDISLRIAIAHEWCVTYAGSERCVEQLIYEYPDARLLTTLVKREGLPAVFARAEPSLLQRLPGATSHHQVLLPLMPASWRLRRMITDVDVMVTSSHACAKGVHVDPRIPHVCYCHTPMRYAWEFNLERERFPRPLRMPASIAMAGMRRWDRRSAERVHRFVANSRDVAQRVRRAYGRNAIVVHPPVDTSFFTPGGLRDEYFLYVGRLVAYKRPDLVVQAFQGLSHTLKVVGVGPMEAHLRADATPNVEFLGAVDAEALRGLMRSARALIFPAHEDFGIVMAEALACGTPVIALAAGGALDIVAPGDTGWLIAHQDASLLRGAIREAAVREPDAAEIAASAQRFSEVRFRAEMREIVEDAAANGPRRS